MDVSTRCQSAVVLRMPRTSDEDGLKTTVRSVRIPLRDDLRELRLLPNGGRSGENIYLHKAEAVLFLSGSRILLSRQRCSEAFADRASNLTQRAPASAGISS